MCEAPPREMSSTPRAVVRDLSCRWRINQTVLPPAEEPRPGSTTTRRPRMISFTVTRAEARRLAAALLRAHAGRELCVPLTGLVEAAPQPCARRLALKAASSTASRSLQAPR